jgi:hypothetical protein
VPEHHASHSITRQNFFFIPFTASTGPVGEWGKGWGFVCKAPRAFKDKAAALLILGDTNEYLYWNFTANARRGTLLYALDARSPGYATDLGMVGLSRKGLKGRSSSKITFRVPKGLLSYQPTPHCS